jgi:hypothetical protein
MNHDIDSPIKQTQVSFSPVVLSSASQKLKDIPITSTRKENTMETTEVIQKHVPSNLFDSKEQYLKFKKQWAKLAKAKNLTSSMVIFYNVARGLAYFNGFTPITNKVKLDNGMKRNAGLDRALYVMNHVCKPQNALGETDRKAFIEMFEGTINDEFVTKVANYV